MYWLFKILDSVLEDKGIMEKGLDASDIECIPSSETSLTATEIRHMEFSFFFKVKNYI